MRAAVSTIDVESFYDAQRITESPACTPNGITYNDDLQIRNESGTTAGSVRVKPLVHTPNKDTPSYRSPVETSLVLSMKSRSKPPTPVNSRKRHSHKKSNEAAFRRGPGEIRLPTDLGPPVKTGGFFTDTMYLPGQSHSSPPTPLSSKRRPPPKRITSAPCTPVSKVRNTKVKRSNSANSKPRKRKSKEIDNFNFDTISCYY